MIGDALKTDLPFFDVCVANLPYQVSILLYNVTVLEMILQYLERDGGGIEREGEREKGV